MSDKVTDQFPRIFRVRQRFDSPTCGDVTAETKAQLSSLGVGAQIQPGQSIAITAGSRGIANIAQIIQAIAQFFIEAGGKPFIVPSMGSHGGGTADGQRKVLEAYGVTESFCGCPIQSSMETVVIGEAEEGFPIYFDKLAHAADHVVICNRVKPHTNFAGDIQSGLMKMMMIGLGKKDGAALYHRAIHDHGFPQIIRSVAPQVVNNANILCGVAMVENGLDDTAEIRALKPEEFETGEKELLTLARDWMPKLPFTEIDVLLIDRIGKNISGTGMDTNVIGRKHSEHAPGAPTVKRLIVRGLTNETQGNATGIGFSEFCLSRVVEGMDREVTILNCLTALDIPAAQTPVHYPTDKETVATALGTLGLTPSEKARLVWIRDTGHLEEFYCSEAFLSEVESSGLLEAIESPTAMSFDAHGMLGDV